MTSVPHLSGRLQNGQSHCTNHSNDVWRYRYSGLKSSIPPSLIKVSDIRTIVIQNLCDTRLDDASSGLKRYSQGRLEGGGGNGSDDEKNYYSKAPSMKTPSASAGTTLLRKGKSSYNLKSQSSTKIHEDICSKSEKNDKMRCVQPILNKAMEIRRQLEFQALNDEAFFQCFYTLNNFLNIEEPYFISRLFPVHVDLADELELKIPSKSITINLFVKHESQNWKLLKQYHIKMSFLINLGDDIDAIKKELHQIHNLLLIRMSDDCYYILPNEQLSSDSVERLEESYYRKTLDRIELLNYRTNTCTYDQILTMNNYSRCICDLKGTKNSLNSQITKEFKNQNSYYTLTEKHRFISSSNSHLQDVVSQKVAHNYQLEQKLEKLKRQCQKLKSRILKLKYPPETNMNAITIAEESEDIQVANFKLTIEINHEKARISSIIQFIFPMHPIKGKYDFSLFQTSFPEFLTAKQNKFEDSQNKLGVPISILSTSIIQKITQISRPNSERLNALIGYITLIIVTIADIFKIPLRYNIRYLGSSSYITDSITNSNKTSSTATMNSRTETTSASKNSQIYPLFICQNATLAVKFTYGLLLLRKNIEQLYETEKIMKIEESNLLVACKIWLTCIDGYTDLVENGTNGESLVETGNYISDPNSDNTNSGLDDIQDYNDSTNSSGDRNNTNNTNNMDLMGHTTKRDDFTAGIKAETPIFGDLHEQNSYLHSVSPLIKASVRSLSSGRRVSNASKFSKFTNSSELSRETAISRVSLISAEPSANFVVNEHNSRLVSEERIKHIKKHLLKGSGRTM